MYINKYYNIHKIVAGSRKYEYAGVQEAANPTEPGTLDPGLEKEAEGDPGSGGVHFHLLGSGTAQQGGDTVKVAHSYQLFLSLSTISSLLYFVPLMYTYILRRSIPSLFDWQIERHLGIHRHHYGILQLHQRESCQLPTAPRQFVCFVRQCAPEAARYPEDPLEQYKSERHALA